MPQDDGQEFRTKEVNNNGFHPIFKENNHFVFKFCCAELGFLIFEAIDQDLMGSGEKLGSNAIPVKCIKNGYRVFPLRDKFAEISSTSCVFCYIQTQII